MDVHIAPTTGRPIAETAATIPLGLLLLLFVVTRLQRG